MESVEFIDSTWRDCSISGRDRKTIAGFDGVKFQNSHFQDVKIKNCVMKNVTFVDVSLRGVKLEGLELRDRTFRSTAEVMAIAEGR